MNFLRNRYTFVKTQAGSLSFYLLFQFRVVTAPFHRVGFADFWLADQLNSLVVVLMDLEYMICFYSFELDWKKHDGLINSSGGNLLKTLNCMSTPLNLGYGEGYQYIWIIWIGIRL